MHKMSVFFVFFIFMTTICPMLRGRLFVKKQIFGADRIAQIVQKYLEKMCFFVFFLFFQKNRSLCLFVKKQSCQLVAVFIFFYKSENYFYFFIFDEMLLTFPPSIICKKVFSIINTIIFPLFLRLSPYRNGHFR